MVFPTTVYKYGVDISVFCRYSREPTSLPGLLSANSVTLFGAQLHEVDVA